MTKIWMMVILVDERNRVASVGWFAVYSSDSVRPYRGVVERIVEELAEEIRMGALGPGSRLSSERKLCERFSASRTSVREALSALSSQGLIQIQMGRGSFVADFTTPKTDSVLLFWEGNHDVSLNEVTEVRLAIEPQIAALAALRASEEQLEQLQTTLDNLRGYIGSSNLGGRVFADIAFHDCLVKAANNQLYTSIYRGIEPILFDIRRMGLKSAERSEKVLGMHTEIYRAVKNRDPDAASSAMWAHLLEFLRDMEIDFDAGSLGLYPRGLMEERSK